MFERVRRGVLGSQLISCSSKGLGLSRITLNKNLVNLAHQVYAKNIRSLIYG